MAFIAKSTIQEVNDRLDAIAVVGDYVSLEKKSGRWWGRCPFHAGGQEKTPSFKVDPDLKTYHCFGCGKGGGVIGFVMEMDKLTYPEAVKIIARKLGVEIVYEQGGDYEIEESTVKEDLFELYRRTTVTFRHLLNEKPEGQNALKYLSNRLISKDMIDTFKLGYAPSDLEFLYKFLKQKGYSDEFLGKSGLFSARYKSISLFSGRLIFPISDRLGRIVAFGGRCMPGMLQSDGREPPKYINSAETEIYKKGQTLFAIDLAKPEMRKTKTAVLAEGYMDVIALHQAGIINAVAPLGTAFTDEQAGWLRRWVEKIILIFDDDAAGQNAAYKAVITCRKNGISCDLIQLKNALKNEIKINNLTVVNQPSDEKAVMAKDPADILQKFGPQILKNIFKYTINDFEYLIFQSISKTGNEGGINRTAEYLFPYLDALESEVERNDCTAKIADAIRIDRSAVHKDYTNWKKQGYLIRSAADDKQQVFTQKKLSRNAELVMLTSVAVNMELYVEFRAALEIKEIANRDAKELFIAMEESYKYGESGIDSLLARINNDPLKDFIVSNGDSPEFRGNNARRLMEDGIKKIKTERLRKRLTEIGAEIREIERGVSENMNIDELLEEKKIIDSQIRKFEGR